MCSWLWNTTAIHEKQDKWIRGWVVITIAQPIQESLRLGANQAPIIWVTCPRFVLMKTHFRWPTIPQNNSLSLPFSLSSSATIYDVKWTRNSITLRVYLSENYKQYFSWFKVKPLRSNNIKKSEGHPRLTGLAKTGGTKNQGSKEKLFKRVILINKKTTLRSDIKLRT